MKQPAVTIIVAVYQAEKTIDRCLNSILNQTFSDWQAILVNDASSDGSLERLFSYAEHDRRFMVVSNDNNLGVAAARNRALDLAGGDYVAFLDADDWWDCDMLSTLLDCAQRYGAEIVQCKYQYNYANGGGYVPGSIFKLFTMLERKQFYKIYWRMMTGMKMNHVCMKLIKRDLVKGLRFDTKLKTGEDLAFCIRLIPKAARYVYIPAPMYHYYREKGNLTGSSLSFREKWNANRYISSMMIDNLKNWEMKNPFFVVVAWFRPYLLTVSKLFRTLKDTVYSKGVQGVEGNAQK